MIGWGEQYLYLCPTTLPTRWQAKKLRKETLVSTQGSKQGWNRTMELQGRGETGASTKATPSSVFRSICPEAGCHMTATQCLTPPPFSLWWQCVCVCACNDTWTTHYNSTLNLFHNEQKLDGCVRETNRRDTGGRNSLSILSLLYSKHPGSPSDSC